MFAIDIGRVGEKYVLGLVFLWVGNFVYNFSMWLGGRSGLLFIRGDKMGGVIIF